MRVWMRKSALLLMLGAVSALEVQGQPRGMTRAYAPRRAIIVVMASAPVTRVQFAEDDRDADSVFVGDAPTSVALLESAIGVVAARRSQAATRVGTLASPLSRDVVIGPTQRNWLPAGDRQRLAAFVARLRNTGAHCRTGMANLQDRCLAMSQPNGSDLVRQSARKNVTVPS